MKPILFNTEMVRAVLDGRKTVTRRVVKNQATGWNFDTLEENPAMLRVSRSGEEYQVKQSGLWAVFEWDGYPEYPMIKAPYENVDILYVRETWAGTEKSGYVYKADRNKYDYIWRPSIYMPREAARIFLRVTDVRVERLRDISVVDIVAEGVFFDIERPVQSFKDFINLWDSTIKPTNRALYGWDANPWVWVIEFECISREEAEHGTQQTSI